MAHELYVWSTLEHTNILELAGLAIFQDQFSIVSPWMDNGTLLDYISQNPGADRYELVRYQASATLMSLSAN
jgi:serine/threonine protein kinase